MDIGSILLYLGFILNFIALAFREILWIRVLLTLGYLFRFLTQYIYADNINASIWMVVFVVINLVQIIRIINERRKSYIVWIFNLVVETNGIFSQESQISFDELKLECI